MLHPYLNQTLPCLDSGGYRTMRPRADSWAAARSALLALLLVSVWSSVFWTPHAQASDAQKHAKAAAPWSVSFGDWWPGGNQVKGSGRAATVQRAAVGFDAIEVTSPVAVVIRQGQTEGVTLSGDDNLLPLIETELRGKTLHIDVKPRHSLDAATALVVTIDVVQLRSIKLSGSSQLSAATLSTPNLAVSMSGSVGVRIEHLTADSLNVAIGGSGRWTASGSVPKQKYSIAGAGHIHSDSLQGEDIKISIAGSAAANVHAQKNLGVSIAGSGSVNYSGDPVVKSSVVGSARLRKI